MLEARAICQTCGHTRDWHDRDAERARLGSDPPVERPCYREVGGAPCRCGGFRESGTFAIPAGSGAALRPAPRSRVLQNGVLTLLLVVIGLALLYAYRSQTPSVPQVSVTQALQDINSGRVRAVTIAGPTATLELKGGPGREQTTVPDPDTILGRAVADYNAANPSQPIALTYVSESQPVSVIRSVILSLLPVLLIGGFFYYMMRTRRSS